jgi:predicted PurR-regulated permease PerM
VNPSLSANPPSPLARGIPFLTVVAIVAVLHFGQDFFLPIALAVLISFLLAPVIRWLEKLRVGRVSSVVIATLLAFSAISGVGYTIAGQLIDLANTLPTYKSNLHAKVISLKSSKDGPWNRATNTLRELSAEFTKTDQAAPADAPATRPAGEPLPVEVVYTPGNALETLKTFLAPIAGPLGMAAVVAVLVIFMLLEREDLRDRMIHLIGRGRLHVTTQAVDEAGGRVSRYLVAQCIVNVTYGIPIGFGLWLIGIPNAVLWGLLAAILRFVPYIGPWIAASFPLVLSLAVAPSWNAPLLTLALFVVVELVSNNVVEPWLYGSSTGLSPMAIIVAAVFWAWLWGPVGLLLATPITVCIAVLGKYIPSLAFLDILLGETPPIAPSDRCYQRLLALDADEVSSLCEDYTTTHSLAATFDEVIVPVVRLVEAEFRAGNLDDGAKKEMYRVVREVVVDLGEQDVAKSGVIPITPASGAVDFLCLPASNESDELAALMLLQLLARGGLKAEFVTSKALVGEMVEKAAALHPKLLCISSVPPASVIPAQHLCRRLRERLGKDTRLMVGLWNETPAEHTRRLDRFKRAQADEVFLTLTGAANEILLQAGCETVARVV